MEAQCNNFVPFIEVFIRLSHASFQSATQRLASSMACSSSVPDLRYPSKSSSGASEQKLTKQWNAPLGFCTQSIDPGFENARYSKSRCSRCKAQPIAETPCPKSCSEMALHAWALVRQVKRMPSQVVNDAPSCGLNIFPRGYLYLLLRHDKREPSCSVRQLFLRLPNPQYLQNKSSC